MKKSRNIKIGLVIIILLLLIGVTSRVSYSIKNKEAEIYINSEEYYIDGDLIKPIKLKTPKEEFQKSFKATANTLKLDCENGTEYVGTNCIIKTVNSNESISEYKAVVYGDISGDGKGTITDIVKILEQKDKNDAELAAGDIDYNKKVDKEDAVLLAKNILLNEEILLPKSEEVPTKIEVSQDKIVIARGESQKIIATTNKGNTSILSWESKNTEVAEVDGTGNVRGVGEGKTKIEVTASDGTKREIEVEGYVALTGISLNKDNTSLIVNNVNKNQETLIVTKTPSDATIPLSEVKWQSNNGNVVKVNNEGEISAVGNGHATITAEITDIHNKKTYRDTIEVEVTTEAKQVVINKSLLELNTTTKTSETLTAEITPNDTTNKEVTWSVVKGNAVTVDSETGLVTVQEAGDAKIRATAKDGSGIYGECDVKVYVLVTGLTLTNNNVELNTTTKTTETIGAIINPGNATMQNVEWSSDNDGIATVENGKITAKGVGNTVIRATITDPYNGNYVHTATCNVSVSILTTGISLNNNKMVMVPNEKRNLIATITPTNATNKNITWKSENLGVATVKDGVVTAVGKGNTKIIAKTNDGYETSCDITVDNDIYDVILFWGQSNMVGYAGSYNSSSCDTTPGENCADSRIGSTTNINNNIFSKKDFSKYSGISTEILDKYTAINHVDVPITEGTLYDYFYYNAAPGGTCTTNNYKPEGITKEQIVPVTKDTKTIGEFLFSKDGKNFYVGNCDAKYSIMASYGTNMMPWFGYEYYNNTKHKVIIVSAANGGEILNHFLPHGDKNGCENGICTTKDSQYLYEAMIMKYKGAISYIQKQGYTIGNKFDILFQGESDANRGKEGCDSSGKNCTGYGVNTMRGNVEDNLGTDTKYNCSTLGSNGKYWQTYYEYIHNKLKSELGIEFGAIIETAREVGQMYYCGVEKIQNAQENAINSNKDVILGSSYPYDRYVSSWGHFNHCFNSNGNIQCDLLGSGSGPYGRAFNDNNYVFKTLVQAQLGKYDISNKDTFNMVVQFAKLSQSISTYKGEDNIIHFNSAALSQIGKDTANNVSYYLKNGVEK